MPFSRIGSGWLFQQNLVNPRTGRIIGRVAVSLVADRFSRVIVGFDMTVDVLKHTAVALALLNAATEKVGYGRELGLHVVAGEWPSGRPDIVRLAPNSFDYDAQWAPIAGGIAVQLGSPCLSANLVSSRRSSDGTTRS